MYPVISWQGNEDITILLKHYKIIHSFKGLGYRKFIAKSL